MSLHLNMAYCVVRSFFALIFLVACIQLCQSSKEDFDYFPVLLTNNFQYRYFSVEKNQKLRSDGSKVKRVQVYDDMECVCRCTRMGDECKSVNYKKKDTGDGPHLCELVTKDKYDQPSLLRRGSKRRLERSFKKPLFTTHAGENSISC
jgi:hypothetical protein